VTGLTLCIGTTRQVGAANDRNVALCLSSTGSIVLRCRELWWKQLVQYMYVVWMTLICDVIELFTPSALAALDT